jgi:phage terminase large subunit
MSEVTAAPILLPPKLVPVLTGELCIAAHMGGRGSAKTRSFVKMAAVRAMIWATEGCERIVLCGREFMISRADSSFAEVKAAISSESWLAAFLDVGETYIRTKCRRISSCLPASGITWTASSPRQNSAAVG